MKKKRLILGIITIGVSFMLSAQNIVNAFIQMPNEYYLSLPTNQRNELVNAFNDSVASNSDTISAERKNRFRGNSSITEIDTINQFIAVKNSINGKVELKILPSQVTSGVSYFALIFTACAPICDSHIGFYDTNWHFIRNISLPKAKIIDFLDTDKIKADNKTTTEMAKKFDIIFIEIHFANKGNDIEAILNSAQFLDQENYEKIKPYLKGDKILYKWEKDAFVKNTCYW